MSSTGWVKVELMHDNDVVVRADSFGEAASQVQCGRGEILYFEWIRPRGRNPLVPDLSADSGTEE